jgi:hypothetical protein
MDKAFIDTVRLLLAVAPEVFRGEVFAMKGGTALDLFVHDMPRLSVDIDVAYPAWATPRDEALRSARSSSGSPDRQVRALECVLGGVRCCCDGSVPDVWESREPLRERRFNDTK